MVRAREKSALFEHPQTNSAMSEEKSQSAQNLGEAVGSLTEGQKVFDRYTLMKIVGAGRMSVVWLAWDESREHDCALKFLPDMVKPDPSALATLKREAQMVQDLKHEQIVPILAVESEGPLVAVVSPAIEGATLSELREQKSEHTYSPAELSDWMGQVCEVLEFAHGEGYVHGNLKPNNLMVDQKGTLRILDFGLERHLLDFVGRATDFQDATPELYHLSPQQAAGEVATTLDDIYAIGASLYELLTSKAPFHTGNLMLQIEQKVPPSMTHRRKEMRVIGEPIFRIWEETVAACLSKDPTQRPQEVAQLVEMLELQRPVAAQVDPMVAEAVIAPVPKGLNKVYLAVGGLAFAICALAVFNYGFKKNADDKTIDNLNRAAQHEEETKKLKEEAAKKTEEVENRAKAIEEAARLQEEKTKQMRLASKAEIEKIKQENAAEKRKNAEQMRELEAKVAAGGKTMMVTNNAPLDAAAIARATKAAEEHRAELEKLRKKQQSLADATKLLEKMQKEDAERVKKQKAEMAAKAIEDAKNAEIAAAEKKDMESQSLALADKRRKEQEGKRGLAAMAARKEREAAAKVAEERRIASEEAARKKREEELARKRFAPEKTIWNNSLDIRVVKIGDAHVAATECRVSDYRAFVKATNHDGGKNWERPGFTQDDSHPVVNVSWDDAQAFCKWLTETEQRQEILNGYVYRLPTDLEWSQAAGLTGEAGATPVARDGKVKGVYPWGKEWPPGIGAGNYAANVTYDDWEKTAPVGSFRPNKQGVYDLGGNVWEWCADSGDSSGKNRVLRGGSWSGYNTRSLLASYRRYLPPAERKNESGFRIVLAKK
jgi:formylglycine-generating enzyme required for sulfatase activity